MAPLGFKGRVARMLLNFLDEHGNYRESLEEAAARAAAAEANSLLARDRRGRKKGRRSRNKNNIGDSNNDDNDDWEEYDDELLSSTPNNNNNNNNGLPEDPYEQIQFYYQTFKSRSTEQLRTSLYNYQLATTSWVHTQLHHDEQISHISLLLLLVTTLSYTIRKRSKTYGKYARIHSILNKKFSWRQMYLHPNFIKGYIFHQYNNEAQTTLDKLESKASKAEEAALLTLRPYQRTKFERYSKLEKIVDNMVEVLLIVGMVLSGMTFCMSLHNLLRGGSSVGGVDGTTTDGHIYSLDGPTDSDGYPIHLRNVAEQKYAECIVNAEVGGNDPNELCDLNSFFMNEVNGEEGGDGITATTTTTGWGGVLRSKVQILLHSIGIPIGLSTYLTSLPSQTLAYLSSLFTLCLFLLSHYIAHKIHMATMSNDPMKHFVIADKTMKADGRVEAKKGETEAQRKKRERMLQMERYKAQMAQLAQEAKAKAQARIARMEGVEAAKREEEEKEKKVVEEQDETVKLYGRQFMMMKAGVPDGAILNSLLPMGVEEEEAKEIITKLREVKARREAEARKAEEEEAKKEAEEKKLDAMKEKIAADRLKKMKSGGLPSSGPPSMGLPPSLANAARKGYNRSKSLPAKKSPKKTKPTEKTEAEKAEEAKRTEAMKERIAAREGAEKASGLKVAQPWACPGKKERTGAKNKRWDKVTKSWVDRDLETEDADAVPTSVVLKADEGGERQEFEVFAPTHKTVEDNAKSLSAQPTKKAAVVDPTALKSSMLSQIRAKSQSPVESKTKTEFKAFVPTHASTAHRVVSPTATKDTIKVDEKKYDSTKFNPITPKTDITNTTKTQETKMSTPASSTSSSPPPVLLRVTESPDVDDAFSPNAFDNPSAWSRRSRADDIKAMIDAVESAPDDQADAILLGHNSLHTPAFEAAMRASEASWDKRPSSRDIMAKIRAAEQQEAKTEEAVFRRSSSKPKATMIRIDEGKNMVNSPSRESSADPKIGTSLLRKSKSQGGINSDDDISEISMNDDLTLASATLASPIVMRKQMASMVDGDMKSIPKLDTSEKSVSKTEDQGSEADTDTTAKKSAAKSESATSTKEETEEEKLRRKKAEDRAKKFEAMNARRRKGKGDDDGTAVSGISRRHRIRRKRSALAAITPDEQKRNDWKKGIFASVLNVEQERWKTSIYAHVINAEETRATNIKAQKDLEELNAAAKRRVENQKRLDAKAKKFAARAEKFHKLRRTDDGSVVSSSSRLSRRRRTRKTGVDTPPRKGAAPAPETPVAPPQAQMVSPIREEEQQKPEDTGVNDSVASKQLFNENVNADQPKTEPINVEEADAAPQTDAADARDAPTSTELVKEEEKDASAETDQKDDPAAASSDQYEFLHAVAQAVECEDTTNEPTKGIDLEGEDEAEKGVDEANAALNSVTVETDVVVEESTSPAIVQKESNGDNPLEVNEIMGMDASLSYDEVLDKLESEESSKQVTPTTSNEDDKGEEKKIEAESDKAAPKSPSKIGAIKNMKNRRKAAAAKKKKRKGSTN